MKPLAWLLVPLLTACIPTAVVPSGSGSGGDELVGDWRVASERIYYENGGGGSMTTPVTTRLTLSAGSKWEFGTSKGTYQVTAVTDADWQKWGIAAYGPTRKVTWLGWNGGEADGPVEEADGRVNALWVIYRATTLEKPGTVWMRWGR